MASSRRDTDVVPAVIGVENDRLHIRLRVDRVAQHGCEGCCDLWITAVILRVQPHDDETDR